MTPAADEWLKIPPRKSTAFHVIKNGRDWIGLGNAVVFFLEGLDQGDKPDIQDAMNVLDCGDEPVVVAFDVDSDPVVGQETRVAIGIFSCII